MLELGFRNENQSKWLASYLYQFEHNMSFICAKDMLEPVRPLVSSLQGELMEIYLSFKKIDQVIESYQLIRDDIDFWF